MGEGIIYTKIFANRMKTMLTNIIGQEQTAGVHKRSIVENLQLNRDIIAYASIKEINGAIITLENIRNSKTNEFWRKNYKQNKNTI
mgnify:CR=1 FL=1